MQNLSAEKVESIGFLTLQGDEELFAIDGQHRLAGIKEAMERKLEQDPFDEVSVIFVAHQHDQKGIQRTRRLFTTLNKTAHPVSKSDIIALDEDDVMAICVRRLIDETRLFSGKRIAFVASNNMPVGNNFSITTIGNLYDLLTLLFTKANSPLKKKKSDLQKIRPKEEELDSYFHFSKQFFRDFRNCFPEIDEYYSAKDPEKVVKKFRGSHGGNALYRPIGLVTFVQVITTLTNFMTLSDAFNLAKKLPRKLLEVPYLGLMWDSSNETILNSHIVTLREILLYMLGKSKFSKTTLLKRYRKETGEDDIDLPERVV